MSSDVGMPQMDGYELVRELRQRDRTAALPAIAPTGHGRAEDVKQAFAAEFLAHVDKPVDFEHMKSVIATVMGAGSRQPELELFVRQNRSVRTLAGYKTSASARP